MPKRSPSLRRQIYAVSGMTCRSCELLIERRLKDVGGVAEVRVSERKGEVEIFSHTHLPSPAIDDLQQALGSTHYTLHAPESAQKIRTQEDDRTMDWTEIGGILVLMIAFIIVARRFGFFAFARNIEDAASLGGIFVIGLVAATSSCLAVVGGLLLAVSAKWMEFRGSASRWYRFQPLLSFNIGRLAGYFLLGGLTGLLGSQLTLSTKSTGILTIAIAIIMLLLGLNILKLIPKRYCSLPLPRPMMRSIRQLSESRNPLAPAILGAVTFFLPCGFTQSMQLLALGSGSFLQGGIIMLVFALGTLPALLGLSVMSTLAEGRTARWFLIFSGCTVVLLGFFNIQSGLLLTGIDVAGAARASIERLVPSIASPTVQVDPNVQVDEHGRQVVSILVENTGYTPASITIAPGLQTWIYAYAPQRVGGCASMLTDPTHNLATPIAQGGNWLGPIENPQSDFVLTCSMGMLKTNVHVRKS